MIKHVQAIDISTAFPPAQNFSTIASIISLFIPFIFASSAIIVLFTVIYGAYLFITAGGETEELQAAKKIFKWAILGFVVVIISFILARVISRIFNINLYI